MGNGGVKKNPVDYFKGEILHNGVPVNQIYGNYMGYADFDGVRYWDIRQ